MSNAPVISIKQLAQDSLTCTVRLKGKARDAAVLEFWKGSALTLQQLQHPQAAQVSNIAVFLIATRGWKEAERLANKED
jgi:hypothetical protein